MFSIVCVFVQVLRDGQFECQQLCVEEDGFNDDDYVMVFLVDWFIMSCGVSVFEEGFSFEVVIGIVFVFQRVFVIEVVVI